MAFKLTYTDGHEDTYGDSTHWEVDDGVLKMGREKGQWEVFVSPSHWATIEVGSDKQDENGDKKDKKDKDQARDKDEKDEDDKDEDDKDEDDKDDKDEEKEDESSSSS